MVKIVQKILLVEDELILRRTTSKFISKLGLTVITAVDGIEALELLKTSHFDLIVSDIAMPNMNGLDFLRAYRNTKCKSPFIFLTGYRGQEFEDEANKFGVYAYLTKPYRRLTHDPIILKALNIDLEVKHAI